MSGHSQPQSRGDGWSGEPANHKFNSKVPANLCRTWEAGYKIPQCYQLRQTLFVNQDEFVRDFSRLFSHSGGRCSCTKIVAVLMVLVEGQVVPVFGPMTRRSLCARRRGECRSRRPSRSKNQGVWGGDVRVERERGARVALNRPNEPGGPREWLVTPPDGVLIGSDLRRGFRRTLPGSFHQM